LLETVTLYFMVTRIIAIFEITTNVIVTIKIAIFYENNCRNLDCILFVTKPKPRHTHTCL